MSYVIGRLYCKVCSRTWTDCKCLMNRYEEVPIYLFGDPDLGVSHYVRRLKKDVEEEG